MAGDDVGLPSGEKVRGLAEPSSIVQVPRDDELELRRRPLSSVGSAARACTVGGAATKSASTGDSGNGEEDKGLLSVGDSGTGVSS